MMRPLQTWYPDISRAIETCTRKPSSNVTGMEGLDPQSLQAFFPWFVFLCFSPKNKQLRRDIISVLNGLQVVLVQISVFLLHDEKGRC